jgi:arylsulfatase A-like enzyme
LLEAAGTAPDPDHPPDGISLLPVLTGNRAPAPRQLYWRYKTNAQRAVREGDFKYLKIRDNTYLFNVVEDPRERANLKDRLPALYERLAADWAAWNAMMLPEIPDSFGDRFTAAQLADHIGA